MNTRRMQPCSFLKPRRIEKFSKFGDFNNNSRNDLKALDRILFYLLFRFQQEGLWKDEDQKEEEEGVPQSTQISLEEIAFQNENICDELFDFSFFD
jgi:hypothetical protein